METSLHHKLVLVKINPDVGHVCLANAAGVSYALDGVVRLLENRNLAHDAFHPGAISRIGVVDGEQLVKASVAVQTGLPELVRHTPNRGGWAGESAASIVPAEYVVVRRGLAAGRFHERNARQQPPIQAVIIRGIQKHLRILARRTTGFFEKPANGIQARVLVGLGTMGKLQRRNCSRGAHYARKHYQTTG